MIRHLCCHGRTGAWIRAPHTTEQHPAKQGSISECSRNGDGWDSSFPASSRGSLWRAARGRLLRPHKASSPREARCKNQGIKRSASLSPSTGDVVLDHTSSVLSSVRPFTWAINTFVAKSWTVKSSTCFLLLRDLQYFLIFLKQPFFSDKPGVPTHQCHFLTMCFFFPQIPPSPVAHITVKAVAVTDSPTGNSISTEE